MPNPFRRESPPKSILRRPDFNIFKSDMASIDSNPIGCLHEALRAAKLDFNSVCTHQCADQLPDGCWQYSIHLSIANANFVGKGEAPSKQSAKHLAFRDAYHQISAILRSIRDQISNNMAPLEIGVITKNLAYAMIHQHLKIASALSKFLDAPVIVHVIGDIDAPISTVTVEGKNIFFQELDGKVYVLSRAAQSLTGSLSRSISDLYYSQPRTTRSDDGLKVSVHYDTVANMMANETPIEPVAQVGVQDNPGTSTVPHLPNPQPTAVTPASAIQDPALVSALEPLLPHELLNPLGPPNMLGVGGITFDIKDLIYSQYMDCDVQYQYTDDTPQGQVIFQIPYDPTSQYVNPYIRQWLSIHPRYTGALNFRFTIVGNTTFSGLIGFAWYPRAITSNVVKVSEMMKYSYTTMGINEPSNRIFTLFDARQTQFWRDTADDPALNPRPVIVCFIYMTAVSPLKEGITIRIRVASKLSDGSDGPCFVAAEPTIPTVTPGVGVPAPTGLVQNYANILVGMPLVPVIARPIIFQTPLYMAVDGRCYKPYIQVSETGDYIIDTMENWSFPYTKIPGGPLMGTVNKWFNSDMGYDVCNGAFICDLSKCMRLLYTSKSDPNFVPTFGQDFIKMYEQGQSQTTNIQDSSKLCEIISQYATIYQVATFLTPSIHGKVNANLGNGDGTFVGVQYNEVHFQIIYTSLGPVFYCNMTWNAVKWPAYSFSAYAPLHETAYTLTTINTINPTTSWKPETMPAGWRTLALTADVPFVVTQGAPGVNGTFQNYAHPSVQSIFHDLAIRATDTQCLQLTFADLDSGNDLCFARYYQDRAAVVINFGAENNDTVPDYLTLVRPTTRVYVSHIDIVERSNSFPISNPVNFAANTAIDRMRFQLERRTAKYNHRFDGPIRSNSDKATQTGGNWSIQNFRLGAPSIYDRGAQSRARVALVPQDRSSPARAKSPGQQHRPGTIYDHSSDGEITPNAGAGALLAGGVFSGLGQGLGQMAQNQYYSGERSKDRDFLERLTNLQFKSSLENSMRLATYQQELAGFRTPGAIAGVNRAGQSSGALPTSYPGLGTKTGYSPQTTGTGNLSVATQTDPAGFPWQAKTGHTQTDGLQNGQSVGVQTRANVMRTIGSQTNRPPGHPNGQLPTPTPVGSGRRVNPNIGGLRPPVANRSTLYSQSVPGVPALSSTA